jgi:signal transduction histidine kinase
MSLSARLSLFFLAALAAVLLGFSASLYLLGRSYLGRQLDVHLEKALDTLEAAVDVETDGLEWEPEDRRLTLGLDPGEEHVRWAVLDGRGGLVDHSPNAARGGFPPPMGPDVLPEMPGDATAVGDVPGWRLARRHLRLAELLRLGKGHPEDDEPEDDVEYTDLILTVGLSPAPVAASLRRLALALAGVSAGLWILCALIGQQLCRRALVPVLRMAASARALARSDPSGTAAIPSPGTGDELEDLARAFNELLARRHEALERQRRFAGDASHQLRTPLAGLLSLVEVIRRRPRTAEEYEQALDQVHREASRLRQIVEALLFLARSEPDAAPPEGEPIELVAWVPDQLRPFSGHPRADDIRFEATEGPAWVYAHPPLLAQAIENLVDNALKYSEPGTPVAVACRREKDVASLSVSDRGCGMTPEELASVFEPFYRAPEARRLGRPGVGLGLSVAQRIVAAAGGTIEAESEPGRGTRFVLRFPRIPPSSTAGVRPATAPADGEAARGGGSVTESTMAGAAATPASRFRDEG